MPSITSLATKLAGDLPQFRFVSHSDFHWSPDDTTVYFDASSDQAPLLLHEVAHALLGHRDYARDIQLVEMERDAWDYAAHRLGPAYSTAISDETVQQALDTYRDWLHARSACPTCQATGVQTKKRAYKCLACHTAWRVNDARMCQLRRYTSA